MLNTNTDNAVREISRPQYSRLSRKRIQLTGRDWNLLQVMAEQRFLSWSQILKYFFPMEGYKNDRSQFQVSYMRLRKLAEFGLVQKKNIPTLEEPIFFVDRKGIQLLKDNQYLPYDFIARRPNFFTIHHDRLLTQLRYTMQNHFPGACWTPETILQSRHVSEKVPDAVIEVSGSQYAVELELSLKNKQRYQDIYIEYETSSLYRNALYLVPSDRFHKRLIEIFDGSSRIYIGLVEDFISNGLDANFSNSGGESCLKNILL